VLVRGPTVAAGSLAPDGWLHTGDLGTLGDDGRLAIIGRRSDTIVSGGENVAPAEVEAVLLEHPGVADAAVFARADAEWGEIVVAQIVGAGANGGGGGGGGRAPDLEQLRAHCASRLAPFKVPKRFEPVDSVPRGITGKLLRRELR
jgi:O-succinylbenzoic acid--CoA ligase